MESDVGYGTDHGEECERGWGSGGNLTSVTHNHPGGGTDAGSGTVNFTRHGSVVEAWGTVTVAAHMPATLSYYAVLQFTPDPGQTCTDLSPVTDATITGEAVVYS